MMHYNKCIAFSLIQIESESTRPRPVVYLSIGSDFLPGTHWQPVLNGDGAYHRQSNAVLPRS